MKQQAGKAEGLSVGDLSLQGKFVSLGWRVFIRRCQNMAEAAW